MKTPARTLSLTPGLLGTRSAAAAIFTLGAYASHVAQARPPLRTNEPMYENPFDLGSGGASLTRATQDGVAYANPSLPAFGAGTLRSIYARFALHSTKETFALGRRLYEGDVKVDSEFLKSALKTPYHGGVDMSSGFITSKVSLGAFVSTRIDLEGRQFGDAGLPQLRNRSYANAGAALGFSHQFRDILALGVVAKPAYAAESNEDVGLDELAAGDGLEARVEDALKKGFGTSYDVGLTLQKRTAVLDVRLAAVGQDLGDTRYAGGVTKRKQTLHAGFGVTLHTTDSALHCSLDQRDLLLAYEEHWTKRTYAGCKAISARYFGVGAGLYQGYPTAAVLVNLFFVRVEAGTYAREMGTQVGINPRRVYFVALGSEIP